MYLSHQITVKKLVDVVQALVLMISMRILFMVPDKIQYISEFDYTKIFVNEQCNKLCVVISNES